MGERLAVHGGPPVRTAMLPYGRQTIDDADVAAVVETLRGDWITTGPRVAEFERRVAERLGLRHAIAVSSGTAALHTAAFAAGLGPGHEVVVPALTFAATANAMLYVGATPVFADVRSDTLTLDPARVREKLTARTRAIVAVDFAGHPADLDELRQLAQTHGLVLLDDAAHALGAEYHGRPLGRQAHLTTLSFHPVKHVTTGEGGMVVTDDAGFAERATRFRNHGITSSAGERFRSGEWLYEMVDLGFNYRLTDVQCALGLSQLAKLDRFLARREAIAARYRAALGGLPGVALQAVTPGVRHAWHIFPLLLALERLAADRRAIFAALRAEGIGVSVHYVPVYWHPYYQRLGYPKGLCPVAERAYERLLTLPLFPSMEDRDVDDVVAAVVKVVDHFAR
ncbi:MAG: UDP-4-amino-4,6-dideoxy-N-acetyl-beta-L-altrosamine transaminase [Elusimicrobia bacterium GWA2_69_24]|nr:MAG: UDP-4-amino-4,6-dideoxy-N-acetyl-beta-L-altrosamine transaminase [Elusimicrobia bacterium GWA2_69_24]